jgi:hypothetical protein
VVNSTLKKEKKTRTEDKHGNISRLEETYAADSAHSG